MNHHRPATGATVRRSGRAGFDLEVLIPEARARARRRRTIHTVLALVLLGGFALAVNGVDGDKTQNPRTGTRVIDSAAVGVTGSSCLPPGQLPQVPDPLIGGDGTRSSDRRVILR